MICPFCQADNDKVIDSRSAESGRVIRRRRECVGCGRRFTTYERVEETIKLTVIKKDGTRVPYNREKLRNGIEMACYKRPISAEVIQKLVESVEEDLYRRFDREVESMEIGKAVSERLRNLDQVAYVRFASVYKQFRDLDALLDEVRDIMTRPPDPKEQGKLF
ncbi:MAG: transcriptional regulator NrdR [Phycisphaeraceae bacterium]